MKPLTVTKHACAYLTSLAHGIDPLQKAPVPTDSVLSQPALQRCFQFTAECLQALIQEEELCQLAQKYRIYLPSYGLPGQITFSSEPISLSQFLQNINDGRNASVVKPLPSLTLTTLEWMTDQGYGNPVEDTPSGYQLTALGEAAGFSLSEKTLLCTGEAQRLLAWHMDQILALNKLRWFHLQAQCRSLPDFPYSKEPILITEFLQRLNTVLNPDNPDAQKISAKLLTSWLTQEGYLAMVYQKGAKSYRAPTALGETIGLSQRTYTSSQPRATVLYSEAAQHFLVEHLPQFLEDVLSLSVRQNKLVEQLLESGVLKQVTCSSTPLSLGVFLDQINLAAGPVIHVRLSTTPFYRWLIQNGFLEESLAQSGKRIHTPTPKGEALGMSKQQTDNFAFTLYNQDAQRFLLEHLPQILQI